MISTIIHPALLPTPILMIVRYRCYCIGNITHSQSQLAIFLRYILPFWQSLQIRILNPFLKLWSNLRSSAIESLKLRLHSLTMFVTAPALKSLSLAITLCCLPSSSCSIWDFIIFGSLVGHLDELMPFLLFGFYS